MKFVYTGITRFVILTDNYAIKVPKIGNWKNFLLGFVANMEESVVWRCACVPYGGLSHVKQHLCPVVWCDRFGFVCVMKRAEPLNGVDPRQAYLKLEPHFNDHKDDNYGIIAGSVVMIDYGAKR